MENIKPVIENIADDIKDYVETSITLYKHQATQKGAEVASEAIINLLIAYYDRFLRITGFYCYFNQR